METCLLHPFAIMECRRPDTTLQDLHVTESLVLACLHMFRLVVATTWIHSNCLSSHQPWMLLAASGKDVSSLCPQAGFGRLLVQGILMLLMWLCDAECNVHKHCMAKGWSCLVSSTNSSRCKWRPSSSCSTEPAMTMTLYFVVCLHSSTGSFKIISSNGLSSRMERPLDSSLPVTEALSHHG